MSRYHVFLDANILYSWNLNHLVMFLTSTGTNLIEPYWSVKVIGEATRNIIKQRKKKGLPGNKDEIKNRFLQMNKAFPSSNITNYEKLHDIQGVDGKDQHVAKAAIYNKCDIILTNNTADFSKEEMGKYSIKVMIPDSFFCALLKKETSKTVLCVSLAKMHKQKNTEQTFEEYLVWIKEHLKLKHFVPRVIDKINNDYEGIDINDKYEKIIKDESLRYEVKASACY